MDKKQYPIIGIDLGTTYSALATINPAGRPEIIPNSEGERITASAVYFQKSGQVLVGQLAVEAAQAEPDRVVRWVKRHIGDQDWSFTVDGNTYSAADISAIILKKLKQDAEQVLGEVKYAVITVPAYFDELCRKFTMDAARKAGLEVLRIVNEPTAATLSYTSFGSENGNILVFDFGGGTFDVSIAKLRSGDDIRIVASEGDHRLGGYDLDRCLAEHFNEVFRTENDVLLYEDESSPEFHIVMGIGETVKKTLSKLKNKKGILLSWKGHSMNTDLTREEFEKLIAKYTVRLGMLIDDALSQAKMEPEDINHVICVGGSSRIPSIQAMLTRKFSKPPMTGVNPDEAVALGAAIQAGMIMKEKGLLENSSPTLFGIGETNIVDVTNHSYGTIALDGNIGSEVLRNSIIISKNTPIPCSISKSFYKMHPNQKEIRCTITQGEDEDPDFVNVIMEETMQLTSGGGTSSEIRVTYSYDANERMSCEFHDIASGTKKKFDLDIVMRSSGGNKQKTEIEDLDGIEIV